MIPYETFPMHESILKERWFLLRKQFNIPYLEDSRIKDMSFEQEFPVLELEEGDIICLKAFKNGVDGTVYSYLPCYMAGDETVECGFETAMSIDFVLQNDSTFLEVTGQIERDAKIDEILKK